MEEAITPPRVYVVVFVALIILTLMTVGLSYVDLGQWHLAVGLAFGVAKGALVALFFMHLLSSSRLTWLVVAASLLWLAILLSFTLADYLTRGWLSY